MAKKKRRKNKGIKLAGGGAEGGLLFGSNYETPLFWPTAALFLDLGLDFSWFYEPCFCAVRFVAKGAELDTVSRLGII